MLMPLVYDYLFPVMWLSFLAYPALFVKALSVVFRPTRLRGRRSWRRDVGWVVVPANLRLCRSGRGGGFRAKFSLGGASGKDVFGYGEARVSRARLPVPAPLAGKWIETGTTRAGAPSRAAPRPAHGRPVSTTVRVASRPEPAHNRCLRLAGAAPASTRKRRRSAARGTGWPRNRCNWCGRSATHAVP